MISQKNIRYASVLAVCLVGILAPDTAFRSLSANEEKVEQKTAHDENHVRALQTSEYSKGYDMPYGMTKDSEHLTLGYEPGCQYENTCSQCKGWCNNDNHCYGILKCGKREGAFTPLPGCTIPDGGRGGNHCYLPASEGEYYPPPPALENALVTDWSMCHEFAKCGMCEGLCTVGEDAQCEDGLVCSYFSGEWPTGRKNCAFNGHSNRKVGYCVLPEDHSHPPAGLKDPSPTFDETIPVFGTLIIRDSCPAEGCPVCTAPWNNWEGCTDDSFCAGDLKCYKNDDEGYQKVTGCDGQKHIKIGYCYSDTANYVPSAIPHKTNPEDDNFKLTNTPGKKIPEECSVFAATDGHYASVPFDGGSSVTKKSTLFQDVTYIYVIDVSQSTRAYVKKTVGSWCGDASGNDRGFNTILDCEILALETVNTAANEGGNVDLVSLIQFNNEAEVRQSLVAPWVKDSPESRDSSIIHQARQLRPKEATNFEAGVNAACEVAKSAENTNKFTVVIFVSDGAPNLGQSAEKMIKENCGSNTLFQTYAVTADAQCDALDTVNMVAGSNPDTLEQIAEFSGGTCNEVPDVSTLPALLLELERTTWDGAKVTSNGKLMDSEVQYDRFVPFEAPGEVAYDGGVRLPPGVYEDLCFEAYSSTSGVMDVTSECRKVMVLTLVSDAPAQKKIQGEEASFTIGFEHKTLEGCPIDLSGKEIHIMDCQGNIIEKLMTNAKEEVTFSTKYEGEPTKLCYNACYTDAYGNDACATTTIEYVPPPSPKPTPAPTLAPVTATPTYAPTPRPTLPAGVTGDPLMMGLSGQLYFFNGRSGSWYSAISAKSFQWNMKIQYYESCPDFSDTFVSGGGFTFFDPQGNAKHSVQVNVVNPYAVDVGCGGSAPNCLGAGSLELLIDGTKYVVGGDYHFNDGSGRVIAYNSFYQCARKFQDFDSRSNNSLKTEAALRSERRLEKAEPSVLEVIDGLKKNMIDPEQCEGWMALRRSNGDLWDQYGHYTTIIIETEEITLQLEYKQENERCNAHSIDVYVTSVSPQLLDENWEGLIGETKDVNYVPTGEQKRISRNEALKYSKDVDYEVNSAFASTCKGCAPH